MFKKKNNNNIFPLRRRVVRTSVVIYHNSTVCYIFDTYGVQIACRIFLFIFYFVCVTVETETTRQKRQKNRKQERFVRPISRQIRLWRGGFFFFIIILYSSSTVSATVFVIRFLLIYTESQPVEKPRVNIIQERQPLCINNTRNVPIVRKPSRARPSMVIILNFENSGELIIFTKSIFETGKSPPLSPPHTHTHDSHTEKTIPRYRESTVFQNVYAIYRIEIGINAIIDFDDIRRIGSNTLANGRNA